MSNLNDEDKSDNESKIQDDTEKKEFSLEDKLKETEDKLLRSLAELENQRKRFEKDIKEAIEFGGFNFAKENGQIDMIINSKLGRDVSNRTLLRPMYFQVENKAFELGVLKMNINNY